KKPKSGSMIPSVYQPSEYSLGSMRAEIGAASLSVYGDPFDLDPFDDREDEIQVPTPSSVLDAKRRGLSCSALRSHQPVARPISAGLSRGGVSVPQAEDVAEEAPVSDLLGSILSGQSMLLMDCSDVVISRDGSLKATKPTPHRPITLNPPRPGNSHLSTNGIRSQPLSRVPNGLSDSPHQDMEGPVRQPPVRKPPPKPVWVDVSVLPRIPKIKRDNTSSANSSSGSSSGTLPGSSANSLAGNRERTVDQQGTGVSQQNRTVEAQRQRADRTGASSSFSSSFTSTTSSFSASSNSRPSSSSISFRINSSRNPWQAQRLPASGGTLPGGDEEAIKRNNTSKQMLLSLRAKAKEEKSEVYDPFNPTESDSSDNEPENEGPDISVQNTAPQVPIGFNESACHQVKSEPLDVHSDTERDLEMCPEVKAEPESLWDRPCSVKELKDIKKEEEVCLNLCGELDGVKKIKKEELTSLDIFSLESPYVNEIKSGSADLEKSHASLQDEMKVQEMVVEPKKIKIENIWPDENDSPSCSDNPLVINLDTPAIDAVNCIKEPTESYHSPPLKEDMEMSPLQPPDLPIKQELGISSDEDISVDYLIDNLDFIKKEMSESSVADLTEAVDPKSAVPETPAGNKQTTEMVTAGAKSKSQGKRVTWNLQEPAEPQSEKLNRE
ncbi:PHD and RING finger domain-containing protein 1-like, partial [Sinocyclocheilus grahami]|uniref:PHD and RING finger domain-containing protein 1-like n=1 Tax=Sinocyclocheilus grahami TaxID=75366 RepID=UPI0007AD39CB